MMDDRQYTLVELADYATGEKDYDKLGWEEIDRLFCNTSRRSLDGVNAIGGLLREIGLNHGKAPSDDNLPNEVFFAIGELIQELCDFVETCQGQVRLNYMNQLEEAEKRNGGAQ